MRHFRPKDVGDDVDFIVAGLSTVFRRFRFDDLFLQVEREMGMSAGIVAVDRAGVDDVLEAFPGGRLPGAEEVVETGPRPLPSVVRRLSAPSVAGHL